MWLLAAGAADAVCYMFAGCTQVLEQQFQNLGGEITRGKARMKVLRITQPEGWEDELAYLRKKDKQLLEKELLLLRKSDT